MLPASTRAAVRRIADANGIPFAHLAAITHIESGGRVFASVNGKQRPLVLNEPHILFKLTKGQVNSRLVAEGLAYKRQGTKPYPKTQEARWAWAERAEGIAGDVAYEAMSYGVGQVMGYHWQALGFSSFQHFLKHMLSGVDGQIDIMLRYCQRNAIDDELREGRWAGFFRGYNGVNWEKLGYGRDIDELLALYGGGKTAEPDGMLRIGSSGRRVRELQALLLKAGYGIKVDGDFGPSTKAALRGFQEQNRLTVDGVYGPETARLLLEKTRADEGEAGTPSIIETVGAPAGTVVGGTVTIEVLKDLVQEASDKVDTVGAQAPGLPVIEWLSMGLTVATVGLAIAGVAWAGYNWWKSRQTVEV